MLPAGEPKWRRRKAERPAEIVAAALEVFAEKGFAAAKLEEIARRAGVSKGALYLYFETKEQLFRAVVAEAVSPNVAAASAAVEHVDLPFEPLARMAIGRVAGAVAADRRIGAVAKMVIGESRNFPELARIWKEAVVLPGVTLLSGLIARAQAKGEVRPGDPRLFAFGIMGPLLLALMWRETFEPVGAEPIDIPALVQQHLDTVLAGMRVQEPRS